MNDIRQPTKTDVVHNLLENEGRVMLCLDATRPGVDVPRRFLHDSGLRLILNRSMPQPIHFGPQAIESELRFGGIPHYCIIPYDALWGAFNPDSGHGMFWKEAMPESVRRNYDRQQAFQPITAPPARETKPAPAAKPKPKPRAGAAKEARPLFHVIEGGQEEALPEPREEELEPLAETPPSPKKPFLRLVE